MKGKSMDSLFGIDVIGIRERCRTISHEGSSSIVCHLSTWKLKEFLCRHHKHTSPK